MKAYIKTKVKIILLPVLLCILCSACGRHTVSEEYVSAYTAEHIQQSVYNCQMMGSRLPFWEWRVVMEGWRLFNMGV